MAWFWTLALVAGVLLLFGLLFWFWRIGVRVQWRQQGLDMELAVWVRPVLGLWLRVPHKLVQARLRWYRRRLLPELVRMLRRWLPGMKPPPPTAFLDPAAPALGDRPGLPRGLMRRIRGLLRWRVIELQARVGTGDAASSALLIGALRAGLPPVVERACARSRGTWYIRLDPEYTDAHLTVEFNGIWSLPPGQAIVAGFVWWRQSRARRRTQLQKARRGTRTWRSIPSRG